MLTLFADLAVQFTAKEHNCMKLLIPIPGWSGLELPFEHLEEGMSQ